MNNGKSTVGDSADESRHLGKRRGHMKITLPLLFLLTIILGIMMRFRHKGDGLTTVEFILCGTWGFLLAQSSFAPMINSFIHAFAQAIQR